MCDRSVRNRKLSDELFCIAADFVANRRILFSVSLGRVPMSDESNRAEHYRDVAMEYRRLATTSSLTQMRDRYLRMAEHYGKLAEDESDKQARETDE
jgi:hypothetical protein